MFTYRNAIAARQSGFSWARLRAIVWDRRCLPSRVYSRVLQTVTVTCTRVSPTLVRARSACKLTPADSVTLASPDVSPTRRAFIFSFVRALAATYFICSMRKNQRIGETWDPLDIRGWNFTPFQTNVVPPRARNNRVASAYHGREKLVGTRLTLLRSGFFYVQGDTSLLAMIFRDL